MYVDTVVSRQRLKDGSVREYSSVLLRRSVRNGAKVGKETLANLSPLPAAAVDAVRAVLAGKTLIEAESALTVTRSLPHGHVALVHAQAETLGLPKILGPACRQRDLALALVISRVVAPDSKLSTVDWWSDVTLGHDLGVAGASTDEVYAAMDWLLTRQDAIEAQLAKRHLVDGGIAMFDLSSSWMEGTHCELAARGYSRDGKKGKAQIEYGLLTDPAGRPVAIRVFSGDTADPTAFIEAVNIVRDKFGLTHLVMVGDRGMITSARIDALRQTTAGTGEQKMGWITCLRAPAIAKLAADDGPLQMSLFDTQDLAEIRHPDYPGERLIACRNPALADQRATKRENLLQATEKLLAPIAARVAEGKLAGADAIGLTVGKVIDKYKMAKHFQLHITDTGFAFSRNQTKIDAEKTLDGIYVIRTSVNTDTLDAAAVVTAYKNLSHVERDFRHLKIDDLDLRPIRHWLADRVKAHILICMLAAYLVWHLRHTMAPLTYTDQHPPTREDPVTPAHVSPTAQRKASRHKDDHDNPIRSFPSLLRHMATLTRNTITHNHHTFDKITPPTPTQHRAFELLGTPIPITLK
jgi:Transposase DDE domain